MFERDVFNLKIDHGLGAISVANIAALADVLSARAHAVRSTASGDPSYEGKVARLEEAVTFANGKVVADVNRLGTADRASYPRFIEVLEAARVTLRNALSGGAPAPTPSTTTGTRVAQPARRPPERVSYTGPPGLSPSITPPATGKDVSAYVAPASETNWGTLALIGAGLGLALYAWKGKGK